MTHDLANTRRGIPRGGLRGPATPVSNFSATAKARPAVMRGRAGASPSVKTDGIG